MPTNLNALIRYKTIDKCLQNKGVLCTIAHLQEVCSESLGELRGVYKKVSERTIRDDLRVMKSDILGFNAPIVFKDGYYKYTRPYSIFKTSTTDIELLIKIHNLLIDNMEVLKHTDVNYTVDHLYYLIYNNVPDEIRETLRKPLVDFGEIRFSLAAIVDDTSIKSIENTEFVKDEKELYNLYSEAPSKPKSFTYFWDEIFNLLDELKESQNDLRKTNNQK